MQDSATLAREKEIRTFRWHAAIFAIVNLILIAINLAKSPKQLWFQWVLLDWGVGLATHAWLTFRPSGHERAPS
jgi:hypothetical protein